MDYIKIRVKTNAGVNEIIKHGNHYEVKIKAHPKKGRANAEIIRLLNKKFKKKAKIISGLKSKEKLVMLI